jgi:hypothetical protein
MRMLCGLLVCVAALLVTSGPAEGHDGLGRAQPRVDTAVQGSGSARLLLIRLTDMDSGQIVAGATVAVWGSLDAARDGSAIGMVDELRSGVFRVRIRLPRPGAWQVHVRIGGTRVVPTSFSVGVDVGGAAGADERSSSGGPNLVLLIAAPLACVAAAALALGWLGLRRRRRV